MHLWAVSSCLEGMSGLKWCYAFPTPDSLVAGMQLFYASRDTPIPQQNSHLSLSVMNVSHFLIAFHVLAVDSQGLTECC